MKSPVNMVVPIIAINGKTLHLIPVIITEYAPHNIFSKILGIAYSLSFLGLSGLEFHLKFWN